MSTLQTKTGYIESRHWPNWSDVYQRSIYSSTLRKELAMAGLIKRGETWHARVRWYEKGIRKEKQISLKTSKKVNARERLSAIQKVEADIKSGMNFSFPWQTNERHTKIKRFTIDDASKQWLEKRVKNGLRKNTIIINKMSLRYLKDALGHARPLRSIELDDIERFIDHIRAKGGSDTTVNMHLRTVKTMLRYYHRSGKLESIPFIEQIPIRKTEPIYITDEEFKSVMQLESLDNFYKRVFLFYRETGMRLREPMMATLNGNWIDIPPESKTHQARSIEASSLIKDIFLEYKDWLENGYGSTLKDVGDHISKRFKNALRLVGVNEQKHFHSLRHTFAVRSLLKGISIYDVKLLMGHRSVTTTEVYSEMNLKRVAQDFPDLSNHMNSRIKLGKGDNVLGDNLEHTLLVIDDRKSNKPMPPEHKVANKKLRFIVSPLMGFLRQMFPK